MSTAVLTGANLTEWVAYSKQEYIDLACSQLDQLQALRSKRDHWRAQVQASPLGNASDLMYNLEIAFSSMHDRALVARL